jgi:3-isopropylmalate/(R)-2-methylmalate dehydratase small subunit
MSDRGKHSTGRVWRLGPNIDTDALAPGHAMSKGLDVTAKHCLEVVRPEFASQVRPGDCLVAGPGFGIGSSREQAASVLVKLGVAAVVAPSFGGLYLRNAFNVGLLPVVCEQAESLVDGDVLTVSLSEAQGVSLHCERLGVLACAPVPGFLIRRVLLGGLLNELKQRIAKDAHV